MIVLRVPGLIAYRELATRAVSAACKLARTDEDEADPLPEEFTHEVVSALGEAFNNVVIHGYYGTSPGDIIIEIRTESDRMEILVQDFGSSFDPDDAPAPDLDQLPESGMGLFIIRSFVDELAYQPGRPNSLCMTKYYPRRGSATPPG